MSRSLSSVLFLIFTVFVFRIEKSAAFPSETEKCKRTDDKCFSERINEIIQKYPHGYEPLGIPDLEPFNLGTFSISQKAGNGIDLQVTIKDLEAHGFSDERVTHHKGRDINADTRVVEVVLSAPKLTLRAKYKTSGKLLSIRIDGDGNFTIETIKPVTAIKMKLLETERNGKKYIKVDKFSTRIEIEKMIAELNNLFNGDKILGDNFNKVINENWKVLWEEFSPYIAKIMSGFYKKFYQDIFDKYPIDELFLPD